MNPSKKKRLRTLLILATCLYLTGCSFWKELDAPVLKSEIVVEGDKPYGLPGNFKWLDNDRIIAVSYDHTGPMPTGGGYRFQHLVIWDTAKNKLTKLPYSHVGGLCVGDGFIRFYNRVRHVVPEDGRISADDEKNGLERYYGPLDQLRKVKLTSSLDSVSCKQMEEVPLPDWAKSIPKINLIRLKPEHGFIWIERDYKKVLEKPKAIWLFPPNSSKNQGVNISNLVATHSGNETFGLDIKYFQHQQAYLCHALDKLWWIYPNGRLESVTPVGKSHFKFSTKGLSEEGMTRAVMLFGTHDYVNVRMDKDTGLFLRDAQLNVKRLVHGRIGQELEVSLDGCKVAYGIDRRKSMNTSRKLIPKLEVVNLCKEQ